MKTRFFSKTSKTDRGLSALVMTLDKIGGDVLLLSEVGWVFIDKTLITIYKDNGTRVRLEIGLNNICIKLITTIIVKEVWRENRFNNFKYFLGVFINTSKDEDASRIREGINIFRDTSKETNNGLPIKTILDIRGSGEFLADKLAKYNTGEGYRGWYKKRV